jgi:hypothetical protein
MGRSVYSRRAFEARNRHRRDQREQIHGTSEKPPSQTWKTFLANDVKNMVPVDFFTVPTIRFRILHVFLVLAHNRRRILHLPSPRTDSGMEYPATPGGLSLGYRAAVSAAGS